VRALLNDEQEPYRYTDTQFFLWLNTGLMEIYRYRPDAYIGNFTSGVLSSNMPSFYSATDLGLLPPTPYPLDIRWFYAPMVFYITGRADLTDDEFADNNRAMTLLQAFRSMLIAPGG
jgi:hypothetical protein